MNITDAILDVAYSVYDEFGPARQIDRRIRLKEEFPELLPNDIDAILTSMQEVSATVWSIAEQGGETVIGKDKIVQLLQARHPFLREKGLQLAVLLVNYYAWHEGYETIKAEQAGAGYPPQSVGSPDP